MQVQVENRPDGSYRVRTGDGTMLFESENQGEIQAFIMGYGKGLGVALSTLRTATGDALVYLEALKSETLGSLWGSKV